MASKHWAVEKHPQSDAIVKAIVDGGSPTEIAKRFGGISRSAISHYAKQRLPVVAAQTALTNPKVLRNAETFWVRLGRMMQSLENLRDAIEAWLADPEANDSFTFAPRSTEIDVVYRSSKTKNMAKATLQQLLDEAAAAPDVGRIERWTYRHADPRKLLVSLAETFTHQLHLLAQAQGQIDQSVIQIQNSPVFQEIILVVLDATAPYPEVRRAIASHLKNAAALSFSARPS